MQGRSMTSVWREIIREVSIWKEVFALCWDARAATSTGLRSQRETASRTTEERIFLAGQDENISRELVGSLEAGEGGIDLPNGDGIFVVKVPLLQRCAERAIVGIIGVAFALTGRKCEIAWSERSELGRILELCRLQDGKQEPRTCLNERVRVPSQDHGIKVVGIVSGNAVSFH